MLVRKLIGKPDQGDVSSVTANVSIGILTRARAHAEMSLEVQRAARKPVKFYLRIPDRRNFLFNLYIYVHTGRVRDLPGIKQTGSENRNCPVHELRATRDLNVYCIACSLYVTTLAVLLISGSAMIQCHSSLRRKKIVSLVYVPTAFYGRQRSFTVQEKSLTNDD